MITSSAWRNETQAAVGGVGLLLSPKTKKTLCNVFSYSERVLLADFSGSLATTVIIAYSPTNVSPETEVKSFYDTY